MENYEEPISNPIHNNDENIYNIELVEIRASNNNFYNIVLCACLFIVIVLITIFYLVIV